MLLYLLSYNQVPNGIPSYFSSFLLQLVLNTAKINFAQINRSCFRTEAGHRHAQKRWTFSNYHQSHGR